MKNGIIIDNRKNRILKKLSQKGLSKYEQEKLKKQLTQLKREEITMG